MTLTRRVLLQGVSAFAVSPAFAVTTGKFALTNQSWTDLGAGPLMLRFSGDGVYAIADTTPTIPLSEGFTIRAGKSARVMTPSHVWAMARGNAGVSAYVAPISGGAPTVTSVWSAADAAANGMTLSNGGLTVTPANSGAWQSIRSSIGKTAGKLYVEFYANSISAGSQLILGLAAADLLPTQPAGTAGQSGGIWPGTAGYSSGSFNNYYTTTLAFPVSGDVWAFAVDFTTGSIWLAKNNVWSDGSVPAILLPRQLGAIMGFTPATAGALFATLSFYNSASGVWTLQPTAASQKYAPPAGFTPWG